MADLINAGLGAAIGAPVGSAFNILIEQLRFVKHCKDQCSSLWQQLEEIKPLLDKVHRQQPIDLALKDWLDGFGECVHEGFEIMTKCTRGDMWDHLHEVWYGNQILQLKERLREKVSMASMALLSLQIPSTSTSKLVQRVPSTIFGMDHHLKVVHASVLEGFECDTSTCVSIRGMGGSGKTLLAQMMNNDKEIEAKFGSDSIFWITVGRDASISSIYQYMRKYLNVLYHGESMTDQRSELREAFLKRKVLMILDDVWDDVFVENESMVKWLNIASGPGNVTLITTRMEPVTRCMKAREEVILLLSEEDSWRLFCIHAFGLEIPKLDLDMETCAKDVCNECKCLPLALKVIGSVMNGESDLAAWKSIWKRMQGSGKVNKNVDEELFRRLQISYDQLDDTLKICFLYFAAFPEDCEVPTRLLCSMWIAEGLFDEGDRDEEEVLYQAKHALNELKNRCLIESCEMHEDEDCVKIHDLLRDLAVQLTSEGEESTRESLFILRKRNLEVFRTVGLGLQPLKVKRMFLWRNQIVVGNLNAPHLRVLFLVLVNEEYEGLDDPCDCLDANFFESMKDLRYFQLYLDTFHATLPESIRGLRSLEHLNLEKCESLTKLSESIGGLRSLQHLNLEGCFALEELPKSIGGLGSLQYFNLKECRALEELPESIGGLGSLQHLNLEGCRALKELPKSIEGLGSLQCLNLQYCNALKEFPESIGGLGFLQHLKVNEFMAFKKLPKSIGGLRSLQHLNLNWCRALAKLPESIAGLGSLQFLSLEYCNALKELPESIGGLGSLQHLNFEGCWALKELPESIGGLGSLQHLNLGRCWALKELPKNIGGLGSLQHLNLEMCTALEELSQSIGGLGSLQHLDLAMCWALKELPKSIEGLGSLQHLNLNRCKALKELPESIRGLGSLQHLDLECCVALTELPYGLGRLGSLQHLNLEGCKALKELPESIGGLESLQDFNLKGCTLLNKLPDAIGGLKSLQKLNLEECVIENLPTFSKASRLKILF